MFTYLSSLTRAMWHGTEGVPPGLSRSSALRALGALLRPATAASDGAPAEFLCLGVGQVELAYAFAGVDECDAHGGAFAVGDRLA